MSSRGAPADKDQMSPCKRRGRWREGPPSTPRPTTNNHPGSGHSTTIAAARPTALPTFPGHHLNIITLAAPPIDHSHSRSIQILAGANPSGSKRVTTLTSMSICRDYNTSASSSPTSLLCTFYLRQRAHDHSAALITSPISPHHLPSTMAPPPCTRRRVVPPRSGLFQPGQTQ